MKARWNWRLGALALVSMLFAGVNGGCTDANSEQPATYAVRGKVTYLSKPLTKGTITFQPRSGRPATGLIGEDGTYRLGTFGPDDGAIAGSYRVVISASELDHHVLPKPGAQPPKDVVPARYRKAESSGLEATVEKKDNEFNFDLK